MKEEIQRRYAHWGLRECTTRYQGLALRSARGEGLRVAGELAFRATKGEHTVDENFEVNVRFPRRFPDELPSAFETGGRVPPDFHKLDDGSLCLGSPIRLRLILKRHPTITGFIERCLIPFLFGFVVWSRTGQMPFGELQHGSKGIFQDFVSLTGAANAKQCVGFLELLSLRKRIANKRPCPCGSELRLGRCHNRTVNRLRPLGSRSYFAYQALRFTRMIPDLATALTGGVPSGAFAAASPMAVEPKRLRETLPKTPLRAAS